MQNVNSKIYNLYNLTSTAEQIYNKIEELEGELPEELNEFLEINSEELHNSTLDIINILKSIEGSVAIIETEIKRLTELKNKKDKQIDNINKILLHILKLKGEKDKKGIYRLDFDTVSLNTRKSESVEIDSLEKVDIKYINYSLKGKLNYDDYIKVKEVLKDKISIENNEESSIEFIATPDKKQLKDAIKTSDSIKELEDTIISESIEGAYIKKKLNLVIK